MPVSHSHVCQTRLEKGHQCIPKAQGNVRELSIVWVLINKKTFGSILCQNYQKTWSGGAPQHSERQNTVVWTPNVQVWIGIKLSFYLGN